MNKHLQKLGSLISGKVADSGAVRYYDFCVSETERYSLAEFYHDLKPKSRRFHILSRIVTFESRNCITVFQL